MKPEILKRPNGFQQAKSRQCKGSLWAGNARWSYALGGSLQLSDPDYIFYGKLRSLWQNILSAIKVMGYLKGMMKRRRDFNTVFFSRNIYKIFFFGGICRIPDEDRKFGGIPQNSDKILDKNPDSENRALEHTF